MGNRRRRLPLDTLPFSLRDEPPAKVAMLGVAGGTVARAYAKYFSDVSDRLRRR